MDGRRAKWWEIGGAVWTVALGSALHFCYEWSGRLPLVAAVAAVNESTWEHMKLLAVPWIVWSGLEAVALRKRKLAVLLPRAVGLLAGLVAIPVLFYSYTGIVGRHFLWADIGVFVAAVAVGLLVSLRGVRRWRREGLGELAGGLVLLAVLAAFVLWTWMPPELAVFLDPRTGKGGIFWNR